MKKNFYSFLKIFPPHAIFSTTWNFYTSMKKQKFAEVKIPFSTKLPSLTDYNFTQKWDSVLFC